MLAVDQYVGSSGYTAIVAAGFVTNVQSLKKISVENVPSFTRKTYPFIIVYPEADSKSTHWMLDYGGTSADYQQIDDIAILQANNGMNLNT